MKKFNKILAVSALALTLAIFGLAKPNGTLAATTPGLGLANTYGVLASTYTNTTVTTINGDLGYITGPATPATVSGTTTVNNTVYNQAGSDQGTALTALALAAQPCTFIFAPGAINLSTDTTHGTIGVYGPGVYCSAGAMDVGGPLNLSGNGTYIFRPDGALTVTTGAIVSLTGGASPCNVFWTPTQATSMEANTHFEGTVIDAAGVTVGASSTWRGRALSYGGTVTTDTDTITVPTCSATPESTLTVVKVVVNAYTGTKVISDFPLFVSGTPVISGAATVLAAGAYTVTETPYTGYLGAFSGDCSSTGSVSLNPGDHKVCILTNSDIPPVVVPPVVTSSGGGNEGGSYVPPVPPLIDLVKVPSPLALPGGPGMVTYTYTVSNIGPVPMSNVTVVDDSCSSINRISGDTNNNSLLDTNEIWTYTCSVFLPATHTNTAVATGWANGISATHIANATVVVGLPVVPPLIHVTKIPSPLTLRAAGGAVTYTEKVTNPGTVALSNVTLTDNKCAPLKYISGDTNNNSQLDTNETWTYTCRTNLTKTTTNTAIASGQANGLTARDFAVATVVVAAVLPKLPNTGLAPLAASAGSLAAVAASVLAVLGLALVLKKRVN